MILTQLGIRPRVIRFHIESFNLFEDPVRRADVLIRRIKHRIDPVLILLWAKAIFPAVSSRRCTVLKHTLPFKVQLCRPPGRLPILGLHPIVLKLVAVALRSKSGKSLDSRAFRLLHVMVICHEMWVPLRLGALTRGEGEARSWRNKAPQHVDMKSFKQICNEGKNVLAIFRIWKFCAWSSPVLLPCSLAVLLLSSLLDLPI